LVFPSKIPLQLSKEFEFCWLIAENDMQQLRAPLEDGAFILLLNAKNLCFLPLFLT
jgi:hypothetical protein